MLRSSIRLACYLAVPLLANGVLSAAASAAGVTEGFIKEVYLNSGGTVFVLLEEPLGGTRPACATSAYTGAFSVSSSAVQAPKGEVGQSMFELLISARATGQRVKVTGANVCNFSPQVEDVANIRITPSTQ